MKQELQKRLNAYAAAAGTLAVAGTANAQIVYNDINPDAYVHDSITFSLDFDNNGQPELNFYTQVYQSSYGQINIAALNIGGNSNNAVLGSLYSSAYPLPFAMNNGDSISGTNTNWRNQTVNSNVQYLGVALGSNVLANWPGQTDKYLGVRFMIGSNTHYGWVRLSVTADVDSIIIKDYGYEILPGVGLTAGQLVGIPQYANNPNLHIFSSEKAVVIQNSEAEKGGVIRISNINGQLITEEQVVSTNMRISLDENSTGIYLVELLRGDERYTKKVYVR